MTYMTELLRPGRFGHPAAIPYPMLTIEGLQLTNLCIWGNVHFLSKSYTNCKDNANSQSCKHRVRNVPFGRSRTGYPGRYGLPVCTMCGTERSPRLPIVLGSDPHKVPKPAAAPREFRTSRRLLCPFSTRPSRLPMAIQRPCVSLLHGRTLSYKLNYRIHFFLRLRPPSCIPLDFSASSSVSNGIHP